MPIKLGYWNIRGLGAPIRYQLKFMDVPFEMVEYKCGDGPDFDDSQWLDVKFKLELELPNLPYIIDHDSDFSLSESLAIHKYLAKKYKPDLLGKSQKHKTRVEMLSNAVNDLNWAVRRPMYEQDQVAPILEIISAKLPPLIKVLGPKAFLAGDAPTFVDFLFWEVVQLMASVHPELLSEYPTLKTYTETVAALPGLKEYLVDPACVDQRYAFNNKRAKIANQETTPVVGDDKGESQQEETVLAVVEA